jgi:MFS family permease
MLPMMLLSIPAGAAADMYDRRRVGIVALTISFAGAVILTCLAVLGLVTPHVLLGSSFLIGSGMALFAPAWQASVSEQVPQESLHSAVALNSISYNIARSFGPAIGGAIVAAAGAAAAFAANAFLYLPLLVVLLLWRRTVEPSRLPPERPGRAIVSGIRYILHSPPIRTVVIRTFLTGVAGASLTALLPLVSRDLLGGDARLYGIMLGMMGLGAVAGALNVPALRRRFTGESLIRACVILMGTAIVVVAISRSQFLTGAVIFAAGALWMVSITLFNIGVQLAVPRWVAGRAVAGFQTAIAGGIAIGSWIWGSVASGYGVDTSLFISGGALASSALLGFWLRMREVEPATDSVVAANEPEVKLALTGRSGPVIIELDYRVDPDEARSFYEVMQEMQRIRQRNGAYGWSLARDIAQPELWCERFHCPTWNDYLRQRSSATVTERAFEEKTLARYIDPESFRVRRLLERPFGSVRWRDETPDREAGSVLPV